MARKSLLVRYRYWFILAGIVLFMPPLSLLFQFSQDVNFCGTWCPRMFFLWRKGMTGAEFLMGFVRNHLGVVLVSGMLISTWFFGRYWCSHLCPVGGGMEAGSRIVPGFLKIDFSRVPSPQVRYAYLAVYLIAPALGIGSLCCSYCNFSAVPRLFGAAFSAEDLSYFLRTAGWINLGMVAVLGFLAKGGRAYCNLFCPVGALDAISNRLGRKSGWRVFVDPAKCDECGDCAKKCPLWCIEVGGGTARIDQLSCVPCRQCESVCEKEAIRYGRCEE